MLSIENLRLESRWDGRQHYTILDPDFDDGLRFLCLLHAWRMDPRRPDRLHVIGLLPQLPAASELLDRLNNLIPEHLRQGANELAANWPLNLPGIHRIDFENGAVTLTLGVGHQSVLMNRMVAKVDLCCPPQASQVDDVPEHLGRIGQQSDSSYLSWDQFADSPPKRRAIVVGAGFAGMGVAHALALRGWAVTVIDKHSGEDVHANDLGQSPTHAQHACAALTPMVARDDNLRARLSRAGSLRAHIRWGHLYGSAMNRCGAVQLERDQGRIVDLAAVMQALEFPHQWARYVDASEASAIAGQKLARGGIYFSTATQVKPQELIDALSRTAGIHTVRGHVKEVRWQDDQWQVLDAEGRVLAQAHYVVIASALDSFRILNQSGVLPEGSRLSKMHALAGEITFVPRAVLQGGPQCIVSGDGYVLPAQEGFCVTGSSYAHGAEQAVTTEAGKAGNLQRAAGLLNQPDLPDLLGQSSLSGWAGWRAVLPGRLPMIGPVPDTIGLWVACGFASRGLTWAPLAGDLIAAALNAEPLPLENDIIDAISVI